MQQDRRIYADVIHGAILTASLVAGLLLAILVTQPARAAVTDSLIEGAKLCTRQLPRYERQYGIPTHLLSAIASTESGRYHKGLNIKVPWPWTINADGKGYYFETKQEAMAMVSRLRARGVQSIDVGCMQVNLMHHPHAFANLQDAFDPQQNVAYAASFLRALYQEQNSWKKAAAFYHSRTPSRGAEYVGHVYNSWYNIVDRLRMAQVEVPASSVVAMNDMKGAVSSAASSSASSRPYGSSRVYEVSRNSQQNTAIKGVKVTRLPEQEGQKVAAYQSPRMNTIQISNVPSSRRDSGIIVVTPDIKVVDQGNRKVASNVPVTNISPTASKVITVAQAPSYEPASAIAYVPSGGAGNADNAPSANVTVKKSGPTFIFTD